MRKIKMLTSMVYSIFDKSGKNITGIGSVVPGQEIEWNATEAQRFVDKGYAQFVNSK